MHAILQVLARPGMPRVFVAQFLIYGQLFLAFSILPLYTSHLGGTAWTIGVHTTLFTGVGLLLRFYLGPLADTHGRKLPLLLGAFVFVSANGLLLLGENLLLLSLVRAYQGIGLAAYLSASTALVLDLAPTHLRGLSLSLNRGAIALALLAFPAGAEQAVAHWGFPSVFVGGAITSGLAFLLLLTMKIDRPATAQQWQTPLSAAGEQVQEGLLTGFAAVMRRPVVPVALFAMGMTVLAHVGASGYLPLRVQEAGGGEFGPFFLALGIAAFLASLLGGVVDRLGPPTTIALALSSTATGSIGLFFAIDLPVQLAAGVLIGSGYTVALAAAAAWIDYTVPRSLRATAMAMTETALDGSIALGFPLIGALATSFGYSSAFVVTAVGCLLALFMVVVRRPQEVYLQ